MFDVSNVNYIIPNCYFDVSWYLFFAKLANFLILFISTACRILILNTDSTPYFFVWFAAIMVWFFLEVAVSLANFFNLKYSTQFSNIKLFSCLINTIKLYFSSLKTNKVKKITYAVFL